MAELSTTLADTTKGLAVEYIKNVTEAIRTGLGGRAADARKLTADEELDAWMRETATPEKVAGMIEAGASDDEILQAARKYRHALGKAAGRGDPIREAEYHERMAQKAAERMAQMQQQMPVAGGMGAV